MNKHYLRRFAQTAVFGLLLIVLSACAASPNTETELSGFQLQLPGRSLQIVQGSSTDFVVQLNRDRFTDPITVTASDLPAGVTAGAVTTTGNSATLRFLAAADAVQGDTKSISIFATADGKTSEAVTTSLAVRGAPGALDTTFGGGRVIFRSNVSLEDVALAPDGGIMLVASPSGSERFTLAKLTADGKIAPNFRSRSFNLAPGRDFVGGLAVQSDGKIIIAMTLEQAAGDSTLGVVRLTPTGDLDLSFSDDGIATLSGIRGPSVSAVTLAPDGSIVLAGSMFNGQDRDILVARFNSAGGANLNLSGSITDSFGQSNDLANAVAVTPDGSIVIAGQTQLNGINKFILARYKTDGTKDTSFGQAGHVTVDFNDDISSSAGQTLTLQPDGKIIAVGIASNSVFGGLGLVRLFPNGQPDRSFGDEGELILDFEPLRVSGNGTNVILEPTGRIIVSSTASSFNGGDFALARLEPNGKLDLSFGNGGRQLTDFGGSDDRVNSLLQTSDGRLLLVGSGNNELKLARYWP
jgi:uncharacterized delta-60 repeat protein